MEKVVAFRAFDGVYFDTEYGCSAYEKSYNLDQCDNIGVWDSDAIPCYYEDAIFLHLADDFAYDIFCLYCKRNHYCYTGISGAGDYLYNKTTKAWVDFNYIKENYIEPFNSLLKFSEKWEEFRAK